MLPDSWLLKAAPPIGLPLVFRVIFCPPLLRAFVSLVGAGKEDAGPTNNWAEPEEMKERLKGLFAGVAKGRTLYVLPFSMGPVGSPLSAIGVQITDSAYAVANMRIMTRMGAKVMEALGDSGRFVPCMHTVGVPIKPGKEDAPWPQNDGASPWP